MENIDEEIKNVLDYFSAAGRVVEIDSQEDTEQISMKIRQQMAFHFGEPCQI